MAEALPAAARDIVERVRLSYRDWAPAQQRPPSVAGILARGAVNLSLLLRGEGDCWVLRIPRGERPAGVCYARELRLHALAAAQALAPAVVLADPGSGLLVTTYLPRDAGDARGVPASTGRARPPGADRERHGDGDGRASPAAVADLLRAIHALDLASLPAPAAGDGRDRTGEEIDLSPLDPVLELARLRHGAGRRDPLRDLPGAAAHCLQGAAERSRARSRPRVICHNDLLSANRLTHRGQLVAIDWEYARPGDPLFDLAVVASELDSRQRAALYAAYLQRRPTRTEQQRLMDQLVLYSAIAACWYARHGDARATGSARERLVSVARDAARHDDDGPDA
ncbi:MAG: aminoglycoside phosphotransferase family protein [Halieaceae bacterium]|jgi:aminoglycoside phosphotransferase (APT) family kinase protein|nr:aminoglycoside phosphotransferase family protein [Halieaceae bacterium]